MCGTQNIKEEGYCYTNGSRCEQLYKKGGVQKLTKAGAIHIGGNEIKNSLEENNETEKSDFSSNLLTCGLPKRPVSKASWALRIIGKYLYRILNRLYYVKIL